MKGREKRLLNVTECGFINICFTVVTELYKKNMILLYWIEGVLDMVNINFLSVVVL